MVYGRSIVYEAETEGLACIFLTDGGVRLIAYRGTAEEARRHVEEMAKELGGTVPNLEDVLPGQEYTSYQRMCARIFNEGF